MNTGTYIPTVDPLGTTPRLGLVLIFAITALIVALHLVSIA